MKERPILFSAPMVIAILGGAKTQTRRVVKHQPIQCTELPFILFPQSKNEAIEQTGYIWPNAKDQILALCPYGQPGDRLWVREAWSTHACFDSVSPATLTTRSIHYLADGKVETGKGRPSIHMPRWASRISLEITGVRVERLNRISESDAMAEGVEAVRVSETDFRYVDYLRDGKIHEKEATTGTAIKSYASLWESINGPGSWEANPWVWVVEFKRIFQ